MSVNFCYDGLGSVETNVPSSEGHDISNLMSLNPVVRKTGFIGVNFVRPPLHILVKFICPITIHRIVLNCVVGLQKSNRVKLFVMNDNDDGEDKFVAASDLGLREGGFIFYRHGTKLNPADIPAFSTKLATFHKDIYLKRVVRLKILICSTERSTIPALGGVDVWGVVSRSVPRNTFKNVLEVWKKIEEVLMPKQIDSDEPDETDITITHPGYSEKEFADIPEEFYDSITCEIMTVPMLLPSGKFVDVCTLELLEKSENELGRKACDPFTGLTFTDTRKPVFATSLKVRLDEFIRENPDHPAFKAIPRTVGRKNPHAKLTNPYLPASSTSVSSFSGGIKRKNDIDSLLEASLAGLPTFLEKPPEKKDKNVCFKCDQKNTLFKMSCDHLVCRACLIHIKKSDISKCSCGVIIDCNAAERYHNE